MKKTKTKNYWLSELAYAATEACRDVYNSTPDTLEERRRLRDKVVQQLMFCVGKNFGLDPSTRFCLENDLPDFEYALLHHLKTEEGDAYMAAHWAMLQFVEKGATS